MDKRQVIAFVLIFAIMMWWMSMMSPNDTKGPLHGDSTGVQITDTLQTAAAPSKRTSSLQLSEARDISAKPEIAADTITVDTDLFEGQISSLGGGTIISWMLKKYNTANEKYVNLVPEGSSGNLGYSLDIPEGPIVNLDEIVFKLQNTERSTEDGIETRRLVFVHEDPEIGRFTRTLIIRHGRYDIEVDFAFTPVNPTGRKETVLLRWNDGLPSTEKNIKEESGYHKAYALQGGEVMDQKKGTSGLCEGQTDWVAVRNKYFMVAMIPVVGNGEAALLSVKDDDVKTYDEKGKAHDWKSFITRIDLKRDESSSIKSLVYLGPMDYQTLKDYGVKLEKTMDFGFVLFRIFSIPFLHVLQWLGEKVGNYGWAIIIFAIMIKIVLFPLTRKSYESMKAMQTLQPKMKEIQEKYKNDPQLMNKKVMEMYKEQGVNPMGGCLPMLLQMPILISLFRLFRSTIMFRYAEFYGIENLAGPDNLITLGSMHINVLPVIMGVSMIFQQKLSSVSTDPRQKMMAFTMPIFFLFIFYNFASGLNLYYLMFNLFTIAQELIMKRVKKQD